MSALETKTLNERVSVRIRLTKNLGDFNSLSIELGLDRDLRDGETVPEALGRIRAGLERELDKAIEDNTPE